MRHLCYAVASAAFLCTGLLAPDLGLVWAQAVPPVAPAGTEAPANGKTPCPSGAALADATKLVNEAYQDDLKAATTPDQKIAVAQKLLDAAQSEKNVTAQFTLLLRSRDLALEGGDVTGAVAVIDRIGEQFDVDALKMRAQAASRGSATARTPEQRNKLALVAATTGDQAIAADRYDIAKSMTEVALNAAQAANDVGLRQQAGNRARETLEAETAYNLAQQARPVLAANPKDPEANLATGKFHCFIKGQWEKGLPMLALSNDAGLKALAATELAGASSADVQVKLADTWWDAAEAMPELQKRNVRKHATDWYGQAVSGLSGTAKLRVEKRLAALEAEVPKNAPTPTSVVRLKGPCVLTNKSNGQCLDIGNMKGNLAITSKPSKRGSQVWKLEDEAGSIRMVNAATGLSLGVRGSEKTPGADVIQWTASHAQNCDQRWKFEVIENGFVKISNEVSGLYLTVENAIRAPRVTQDRWGGKDTQIWRLTAEGGDDDKHLAVPASNAGTPTLSVKSTIEPVAKVPATVASTAPSAATAPTAPVAATVPAIAAAPVDPNAIERPEFRDRPKPLLKNLASITAMQVIVAADGEQIGITGDIIAVVGEAQRSRKGPPGDVGFVRNDGDETMKTALQEATRAVKLRYPVWEPGHIDLSFGEKFAKHGGPSAGTAFAVLMLSVLEGFDIDPQCAMTGDITVDWKVRKVGGTTAKVRGAMLDKCAYAAIPAVNEAALADMAVLHGNSSLWNIQIFSISTLQEAVALARKDRADKLAEAIKLFGDLQGQLAKDEKATLHSAETHKALEHILELAPNHASAKYVLALCDGKASITLSNAATLYQISLILYPYDVIVAQHRPITRELLPISLTVATRKRISALRLIASKDLVPLVADVSVYTESMEGVAAKTLSVAELNVRAAALAARFSAFSADRTMVEKIVREGY